MVFLPLAFLGACAHHGVLPQLLEQDLSSDLCEALNPPGPPALPDLLGQLAIPEGRTGALLLESGAKALIARAWLIENATESIDAQYFIFSADNLGLVATDALLLAADRGVVIRLLLDDTLAHGDPEVLLALSHHPRVEVRIYNPNLNVRTTGREQLGQVATDFRGVNQRMHNKLFLVDGQVAITGGRNVGGEYFDLDDESNFRDRDVLLVQGAVEETSRSFEEFWSSSLAVPIESLLEEPLPAPAEEVWERLHQYACHPSHYLPSIRARVEAVPASFARRRDRGDFHLVDNVEFVWDFPGKNEETGMWGGGLTTDALVALVGMAEETVVIQTPYLVTTELGQGVFAEAVARGVEVRILTNSLAVTDNVMAFSGYRRSRADLLATGTRLFELKPETELQQEIMDGPMRNQYLSSLAVHAKSMVIDGKIAVVGTFNLDPRSANLNTESITILHSESIARRLLAMMEDEMRPENAWETTREFNPDREAPLRRRLDLIWARLVPRSVL